MEELTIRDIRTAISSGELTATSLIQTFLERIDRFDDQIHSVLNTNSDAIKRAKQLDEKFEESGFQGPLHAIPVLLKDNHTTEGIPTTAGTVALDGFVPEWSASVVDRLRDAGCVIIGKTNLNEFSRGVTTESSLGGQTRNPYAPARYPGGSSGGTGAAISVNFGIVGMGTETGVSIRVPAMFNGVVGISPTVGLVSRHGIIPITDTHDTAGPMARTVEDAAAVLEVISGYDNADEMTARCDRVLSGSGSKPYLSHLNRDGLENARIGVLREYFAPESGATEINEVAENSLEEIRSGGATLVDDLPVPQHINDDLLVNDYEWKRELNRYLAMAGDGCPVDSFQDLRATGEYLSSLEERFQRADRASGDGLETNTEYLRKLKRRHDLCRSTLGIMAEFDLDAIVYPTSPFLPAVIGNDQKVSNHLPSYTGLPAISVPAGYTESDHLPVNIDLVGRPFSEPRLIELAYAYEQRTRHRQPPDGFGPLPREELRLG